MLIGVCAYRPDESRISMPTGYTLHAIEYVTTEEAQRRRKAGQRGAAVAAGWHVIAHRSPK